MKRSKTLQDEQKYMSKSQFKILIDEVEKKQKEQTSIKKKKIKNKHTNYQLTSNLQEKEGINKILSHQLDLFTNNLKNRNEEKRVSVNIQFNKIMINKKANFIEHKPNQKDLVQYLPEQKVYSKEDNQASQSDDKLFANLNSDNCSSYSLKKQQKQYKNGKFRQLKNDQSQWHLKLNRWHTNTYGTQKDSLQKQNNPSKQQNKLKKQRLIQITKINKQSWQNKTNQQQATYRLFSVNLNKQRVLKSDERRTKQNLEDKILNNQHILPRLSHNQMSFKRQYAKVTRSKKQNKTLLLKSVPNYSQNQIQLIDFIEGIKNYNYLLQSAQNLSLKKQKTYVDFLF